MCRGTTSNARSADRRARRGTYGVISEAMYAGVRSCRAKHKDEYLVLNAMLHYEATHTQMSYILYFFKISKRPTIKGQCGLEGIVIKGLSSINQFKDLANVNAI